MTRDTNATNKHSNFVYQEGHFGIMNTYLLIYCYFKGLMILHEAKKSTDYLNQKCPHSEEKN